MAVCIVCGGGGFSLQDGLCSECNGTGTNNFDYDAIIFEDDFEEARPIEPMDLIQWRYS